MKNTDYTELKFYDTVYMEVIENNDKRSLRSINKKIAKEMNISYERVKELSKISKEIYEKVNKANS